MAVLATSISMTKRKKEEKLEWISCIQYLVIFKNQTEALIDLKSKINIMSQVFAI